MSLTKVTYAMIDGATLNVLDFGAVGDGVADDTAAIQAAITAAGTTHPLYFPEGTYLTNATLDFRNVTVQADAAYISGNHANIIVIAGGNSNTSSNPTQNFYSVTRVGGVTSTPDVRIIGAKGQYITIQRSEYVQLYADTDDSNGGSIAYSSFHFRFVDTLELTTNPSPTGSTTQWINENQFYLNRVRTLNVSGTYPHSNNQFWAGTFESATAWTWDTGQSNTLWCARFESGPTITFNYPACYNRIVQTWTSSAADWRSELLGATIVDNGYGNVFVKQDSLDREAHIVASNSVYNNVCLDTQSVYPSQVPSLAVVKATANGHLLQTTLFPVFKNDRIGFYTTEVPAGDESDYRCNIYFYDANKQPVTPVLGSDPATSNYQSSTMTTISGNAAALGTGRNAADLILTTDAVAYVYIRIFAHSTATHQYADNIFAFVRRTNTNYLRSTQNAEINRDIRVQSPLAVTGVPTQGYAPLGFEAVNVNGLARYVVTRSVDTTLTTAETAGATVIDVADATGVQIGDIVGVQNDSPTVTDWTTVAGVTGTTITLTAGVTGACAIGNRVVFVKWATVTY